MPSLISKVMSKEIRLLRPIITSFNIKTSRAFHEALAQLGERALAGRVRFEDFSIGPIPAATATPLERVFDDDKAILYLHGGGYVAGGLEYARGFAGFLAAETGKRVTAIAYRLAPENPYPAALEDALGAYEYLLRFYEAQNISLIGESAGGGLLLALCHKLREQNLPLPGKLVPISPWTDLALSGESYTKNRRRDPSLTLEEIEGFVASYAAPNVLSPFVSPLYGDFTGFPPCRVYVGANELLRDDSVRLCDKMRLAGVSCSLTVSPGMWHAYVLYPTPEGAAAMTEIKAFLEEKAYAD